MKKNPVLYLSLGKFIKVRRLAKKMNQDEVADYAGISTSHLSDIERGKSNPTYDVLYSIARVLDTYPSVISKEVEDDVREVLGKIEKKNKESE